MDFFPSLVALGDGEGPNTDEVKPTSYVRNPPMNGLIYPHDTHRLPFHIGTWNNHSQGWISS